MLEVVSFLKIKRRDRHRHSVAMPGGFVGCASMTRKNASWLTSVCVCRACLLVTPKVILLCITTALQTSTTLVLGIVCTSNNVRVAVTHTPVTAQVLFMLLFMLRQELLRRQRKAHDGTVPRGWFVGAFDDDNGDDVVNVALHHLHSSDDALASRE
jgi:hypothetical protein